MSEKTKALETPGEQDIIVVELENQELRFDREKAFQHYDTFINTSSTGKASKGANNYCVAAILNEDLVAYRNLKKQNPGIALQLTGQLIEQVAPEVEMRVKKP